jgi:hypothetical protein
MNWDSRGKIVAAILCYCSSIRMKDTKQRLNKYLALYNSLACALSNMNQGHKSLFRDIEQTVGYEQEESSEKVYQCVSLL